MKSTSTVLYLDHSPVLGGAERSLLLLMGDLDWAKYRPVLVTESGSALETEARADGIFVTALNIGKIRLRRNPILAAVRLLHGVVALAGIVRGEHARIIHANVMRAAPYAALAAKLTGAKFVWHVRDIHRERWFSLLVGMLADSIIANSEASANALPKAVRKKTVVIHNGVDVARFRPEEHDRTKFRNSIGVPAGVPLIANVGWAAPWKNQGLFVEAAEFVLRRCPEARFVVVGEASDPVYFDFWRDFRNSAKAKLGERFIFAGRRDDMPDVFAGVDLLMHTALDEPFGRVVLEAMAMERPVIALAGGGVGEIVKDGVSGVLVNPGYSGAAEQLGEAAAGLIANPEKSKAYGRAARKIVLDHFDSAAVARKIECIYDELL